MSYLFNGLDQYLRLDDSTFVPAGATGLTIFCWVNDTSYGTVKALVAIGSNGSGADQLALRVNNGYCLASAYQISTPSTATSLTAPAFNGVWAAMAARYTFDGSGVCTKATTWQYNGTDQSTPVDTGPITATISPWANDVLVAARHTSTAPNYFGDLPSAKITHVAVWDKELSAAELTELTTKPPSDVAAANLVAYWPLLGDMTNSQGTGDLTAVGTPTVDGADGPTFTEGTINFTSSPAVGAVGIDGYAPTLLGTNRKLKLLAHSSAMSATGISGVVFEAPAPGEIVGAIIGEFTGASFEGSLESGQAVLKVSIGNFGGVSLQLTDTPVALARNSLFTTGIVDCTVVDS